MSKLVDEIKRDYILSCVHAFLEDKQTINWAMAFIADYRPCTQ